MSSRALSRVAAPVVLLGLAAPGLLAGEPVTAFGGRLRLGGEASGCIAPRDNGFFNFTDYGESHVRLFRAGLVAEVQVGRRAALMAELRSDNLEAPRAYALYLRLRPFLGRAIDVQAGRIPPVFGSFARRHYLWEDPLPGLPLAYQYLTSLRADALPASANDMATRRGSGWSVRYPVGDTNARPGLPLVSGERWDTGVEARVGSEPAWLALAVTQGTLARPRVRDDNDGKQITARVQWKPTLSLVLGASAAQGDWIERRAASTLPPGRRRARQRALGLDFELADGPWILRGEALRSAWDVPVTTPPLLDDPLSALALMLEARWKLRPGVWVAARGDRLGFSQIVTSSGRIPWDAPVSRLEAGIGWSPVRPVVLKASVQRNRRDGGRVRARTLAIAQAVVWF